MFLLQMRVLVKYSGTFLFLCFLIFCISDHAIGRHIVGGEITYECKGNGQYEFEMIVYRDCRPQAMAAQYDDTAYIGVYWRGENGPWSLVTQINADNPQISVVPPPTYPCLTLPPNLCVQKGIYSFDYRFTNWPSNGTYLLVYQRCCRNNTIANIITPGDWGATFYVEINAASQAACNSSPKFANFPPTVLCLQEFFSIDHSAIDIDGDSIVYEFSTPLDGGGQGGLDGVPGAQFLCDGVRPRPGCPPPFDQVIFSALYSAQNPMGGNPIVQINELTGFISGWPDRLGQFVINVVAREFRGDTLMGEIQRDFQFNIGECILEIFAGIETDEVAPDGDFVIISCGDREVQFFDASGPPGNVESYAWSFDFGNSTGTVTQQNPLIRISQRWFVYRFAYCKSEHPLFRYGIH